MFTIRKLGLATALTGILCLGAGLAADVQASDAKLTVPVATWGGPNHDNIVHFVPPLQQSLIRQSGGKIDLRHYPAGQLAEDVDMPIAIPTGKVRFGWTTVAGWSGVIPDVGIIDRPTGLSMHQMARAADMEGGIKEVLDRQFREKGATLLALTDIGPPALVSNKEVLKPSDLEGLRVRVYSEGSAQMARAFGAAPLQMAFADVYTAMQRGTIDAAMMGFQGVASQRMNEVASHVLVPASFFGTGLMGWAANREWWDGLAPEDREIVGTGIREAELIARYEIIRIREGLADQYRELGMEVTILDPSMPEFELWQAATQPLWEQAKQDLSADVIAPVEKVRAEGSGGG